LHNNKVDQAVQSQPLELVFVNQYPAVLKQKIAYKQCE